jgi:hypothetical protein
MTVVPATSVTTFQVCGATRGPPGTPFDDRERCQQHRRWPLGGRRVVTGGVVGAAVLMALMWFQYSAWAQGHQLRLFEDEQERPDAG